MKLLELLEAALKDQQTSRNIDLIEDTFGPNPCQSLVLTHEDGTTFGSACDGKRCVHCGPRKKATIQHQLEQGLGERAYITTYTDRLTLDRDIERTRKAAQRTGTTLLLQSVGDSTLGYIVASNQRISDDSRLSLVSQWMRRILDTYHHSVERIRRSYALGRVSLVRLRRKGNSGQPSMWARLTDTFVGLNAVQQAEIERRDDLAGDIGWHVWDEGGKLLNTIQAWR